MILQLSALQRSFLLRLFSSREIDRPKIIIGDKAKKYLFNKNKDKPIWGFTPNSKTVYLDIAVYELKLWCYGKGITPELQYLPSLAHELRHTTQYAAYFKWGFYIKYGLEWFWDTITTRQGGYYWSSLEQEARDTEEQMQQLILGVYLK